MLRWRLISAGVIIAGVLALVWVDFRSGVPGAWLLPLYLVVVLLASEEVLSLLAAKGHRPLAWVVYLGNGAITLAAGLPILGELVAREVAGSSSLALRVSAEPLLALRTSVEPLGWSAVVLAVFAVLAFVGEMRRFEQPGKAIVNVALAIFAMVYVGVLGSFLLLLRLHDGNAWGMMALVSTLLITKMADTGAFAVGKSVGRTKMAPVLSPGKTWEGTIGGIVVAVATSWVFFRFGGPWIVGSGYVQPAVWAVVVYGVLLAVAGLTGDLAESLLKRDMERKDSSTWLPGLGGVLDVIDAVLVSAPVAWICWVSGLLG